MGPAWDGLSPPQGPEAVAVAAVRGEERVWKEDLEVRAPVYGIEDVPPALETLLYAWQHTLVDVSPYVLPIVVAGAVGYSAEQAAAMISACLVLMGISTFVNATWGNRLPSVLGRHRSSRWK